MDHRGIEAGGSSARALLLTILGELVLPSGGSAWTGAFVTALGAVAIEERAARQALARTAAHGLLEPRRSGRRTCWRLTPAAVRLLSEGAERIYGFGRHAEDWDRRWLVVVVSGLEAQRRLRHQVQTRLTWAGLGSPASGVWVSPDAGREKEVAAIVAELGIDAFSFIGPLGEIGDQQHVVTEAWDLDALAGRYSAFAAKFAAMRPRTPLDVFGAQVLLVNEWRRFPSSDPSLPRDLLPGDWPGAAAVEIFHRRHDAWHRTAREQWSLICSAEQDRA